MSAWLDWKEVGFRLNESNAIIDLNSHTYQYNLTFYSLDKLFNLGEFVFVTIFTCGHNAENYDEPDLYIYGNVSTSLTKDFDYNSDKNLVYKRSRNGQSSIYFLFQVTKTMIQPQFDISFYALNSSPFEIRFCEIGLRNFSKDPFEKVRLPYRMILKDYETTTDLSSLKDIAVTLRFNLEIDLKRGNRIFIWMAYPWYGEIGLNAYSRYINASDAFFYENGILAYNQTLLKDAESSDITITFKGFTQRFREKTSFFTSQAYLLDSRSFKSQSEDNPLSLSLSLSAILGIIFGSLGILILILLSFFAWKWKKVSAYDLDRKGKQSFASSVSIMEDDDGKSYSRQSNSTISTVPTTITANYS
jgi:hypothetical protein